MNIGSVNCCNPRKNSSVNFGMKFDKEFTKLVKDLEDVDVTKKYKTLSNLKDNVSVYCYGLRNNDVNYYHPTYGIKTILPPGFKPKSKDEYLSLSLNNGTALDVYGKSIKDMINSTLDFLKELPSAKTGKEKVKELVA